MGKSNTEYVGVWISQETDNCLRLLSAIEDKRKGATLRDILDIYLSHKEWDTDALVDILAAQLYSRWFTVYREKKNLDAYLQGAKEDLGIRHKLSNQLIVQISKRCKELQKKNQSKSK